MKGIVLVLVLMNQFFLFGATTWYSLSGQTDPNTLTNWTLNADGTGGSPADFTTAGDNFIVQITHSYTTTAIWNISVATQTVTVNGTLTYSHASSIANLTLGASGIVNAGAQNTISGTWTMVSGSIYNFNHTTTSNTTTTFGGTESFNSNAIIKFSNFETTDHAFEDCCNVCTGGFPSVTWDMTGQSADIDWANNPFTIAGNFIMSSTGAGANYVYISNATDDDLTVNGNFTMSGGKMILTKTGSGGSHDLYIGGNFSLSAGTIDFDDASLSPVLYVTGNFLHTGGTLTETGAGSGNITLNGTGGTQTIESTGTSNTFTWGVAASNAQCNVAAGKTMVISAGATFTVSNGTSDPDFLIDGALTVTGTLSANAASSVTNVSTTGSITGSGTITCTNDSRLTFSGASSYTRSATAGTIPNATWGGTSTLLITGPTTSEPIFPSSQTYYNLTWACSGHSGTNYLGDGVNIIVANNFRITDLGGSGVLALKGTETLTVKGDFTLECAGQFYLGDGLLDNVLTVWGDIDISNGTLSGGSSTNTAVSQTINAEGAIVVSGSGAFKANDLSAGTDGQLMILNFSNAQVGNKSSTFTPTTSLDDDGQAKWDITIASGRTITLGANVEMGNSRTFTVSAGGTLICGTNLIKKANSATGTTFTLASGATIKTANTAGLSTTDATGSIQITTISYNSGASYVFNGSSAQVTGNFGASTTPTASTVANLEFNNSAGVTLTAGLTVANSGTLTLTLGYHNLASFTLQLGTSAANALVYTAGGLYSSSNNGSFKRWIVTGPITSTSGNYYGLFPFKKTATNIFVFELNSTSDVTTAGFVSALICFSNAAATDVADFSDGNGTVTHVKDSKMVTLTLTTIAGGTFTVKASSGSMVAGTLTDMDLSCFTGGVGSSVGTFAATTGSTTYPVVSKTGVATASLAIGWAVGTYDFAATTLPIELISFSGEKDGRNNKLSWETQSESNNDYFTIEKTIDGINFEIVGMENGAGNSDQFMNYSLVDFNVRNGRVNYYRLKQTDFDGNYSYSDIISIDNIGSESREVTLMINSLGQEVNDLYRGLVIIYFSDGTSSKIIR